MNKIDKLVNLYHNYFKLYNTTTSSQGKLIYKAKAIAVGEVLDILGIDASIIRISGGKKELEKALDSILDDEAIMSQSNYGMDDMDYYDGLAYIEDLYD